MNKKLAENQQHKLDLLRDNKMMADKVLFYVNILVKIDPSKVELELSNLIPSQDDLVEEKITLVERMAVLDRAIGEIDANVDENVQLSNIVSDTSVRNIQNIRSEVSMDSCQLDFEIIFDKNYPKIEQEHEFLTKSYSTEED